MQNNQSNFPDKNPQTYKKHQQQFLTQILLPLFIVAGCFIALGFTAAFSSVKDAPNTATWAHISTMFIMLLLIVTGLGGLAFIIAGIYGFSWLTSRLPRYSLIAQIYTQWFGSRIQSLADKTASPVITLKSSWAAIHSIFKPKTSITIDEE